MGWGWQQRGAQAEGGGGAGSRSSCCCSSSCCACPSDEGTISAGALLRRYVIEGRYDGICGLQWMETPTACTSGRCMYWRSLVIGGDEGTAGGIGRPLLSPRDLNDFPKENVKVATCGINLEPMQCSPGEAKSEWEATSRRAAYREPNPCGVVSRGGREGKEGRG